MKGKRLLIIIAASLLAICCLISVGVLFFSKFQKAMYPTAPQMPPIVSQSTEEILGHLELQLKNKAPQILTNLQAGLSNEKISELERKSGIQLPDEIKALYRWHNGFKLETISSGGFQVTGPIPGHYFLPLEEALHIPASISNEVSKATSTQRAAFNVFAGFTKSWITLFDDGAGDGFFFDPKRKPNDGAVFFHFMEDSQYVFFPSAKNLYAAIVKCYEQGVFAWKEENGQLGLREDFSATEKIWNEFGATYAP